MAVHAAHLVAIAPPEALPEPEVASTSFDDAFWPLFVTAFKAAYRILRDTPAAEDVAADVLGRLHTRWNRLGGVAYREAWVVRVATNRALDVARRGLPPAVFARTTGFEEDVASRLMLIAAVRRISRRQREVIALHYLVGLPERDVAIVLGISEGSVRRHLDRALKRLRGELGHDLRGGEQ